MKIVKFWTEVFLKTASRSRQKISWRKLGHFRWSFFFIYDFLIINLMSLNFCVNFILYTTKFWTKMYILDKNVNFGRKSNFRKKIESLNKNKKIVQKFPQKRRLSQNKKYRGENFRWSCFLTVFDFLLITSLMSVNFNVNF